MSDGPQVRGTEPLSAVEVAVLRRLWVAVLSSRGYTDSFNFRVENGESLDEIDRLLRRRFMARDGDHYRLTALGLAAVGDEDMTRVLAFGDELYTRLLTLLRDSETRRKSISVTAVLEPL